jgi:hypothetical protein
MSPTIMRHRIDTVGTMKKRLADRRRQEWRVETMTYRAVSVQPGVARRIQSATRFIVDLGVSKNGRIYT